MIWGIFGSAGIAILFYLVQALGMQSWSAPFDFALSQWYFVFPLIIGFGVQTALFRLIHQKRHHAGGKTLITSGGVSTGAMVACCMHNIVLIFPVLGLGGSAIFFSKYQSQIFILSIIIMIFGIFFMLKTYVEITQAPRTPRSDQKDSLPSCCHKDSERR
ncbi:MAG: hypothetical protein NUV81_03000 [bacterium]|nr:hypothetical protein [bacterium]